ncbi:MAG: type II toxin-antitoxin system prevent-host-death family antitoxin [Rickettsiales bacterium]|jgi:prevent-host-death family protein
MEIVGIFEAKTNLSSLLERVVAGEHITISKRGVPVAILSPAQAPETDKRKAAIKALKSFRKGRKFAGDVKELIHEGHKY